MKRAFTLVELLVSIALAVLLIYGVNEVFRLTGQTIASSNALSDAIRDNRAIQGALAADTHAAAVEDSPFFIIRSERAWAYRNQADLDADKDGDVKTADTNGDGSEDQIPLTVYNFRNHRIDVLSFFSLDYGHRQTGNDGQYISPGGSYESWVNYSHLRVRNNAPLPSAGPDSVDNYPLPGAPSTTTSPNPNNFFATQWVLGRSQILLQDRQGNNEAIVDDGSVRYAPLAFDSKSTGASTFKIQQHRYDLAITTASQFRRTLNVSPPPDADWPGLFAYRFWHNPYPQAETGQSGRVTARQTALAANAFVKGCTQFVVEYAGDFLNQSTSTDQFGRDGVIDFVRSGSTSNPHLRIRWYGAYRDTGGPNGVPDGTINADYDVVPLTKLVTIPTSLNLQPWELVVPQSPTAADQTYAAVWKPAALDKANPNPYRPQLIRITVTLDEPSGKLTEGQSYEYIYKLGY